MSKIYLQVLVLRSVLVIYINNLQNFKFRVKYKTYTDDKVLYHSRNISEELNKRINKDKI